MYNCLGFCKYQSFPQHILTMLNMSLIHSYINYCIIVWGSANICHLKPLIVLQNKAIRLINFSKPRDSSAPIFFKFGILSIAKVFHLNCLKFSFKCLYGNKFPLIKNKLMQNNYVHNYPTRHKTRIIPPFERLEIWKNAYLCQSINLWNNLEPTIKESKALHCFKHKVKDYLIDNLIA